MITQSSSYSLAVARALMNGRDNPEFAVMYDNKFLSKKTSTFFDIRELRETYTSIFLDENNRNLVLEVKNEEELLELLDKYEI